MLDLCIPCKNKGRLRAVYKVVKGVPMCGGCVTDLETNPPEEPKAQTVQFLDNVTKKEDKPMAKRIDEETKAAIRHDAAAGLNFNQISAKHSIARGTVRDIVGGNGKKAAAVGGDNSAPRAKHAKNGTRRATTANGASRFADTISLLREERERIDRVIADLEQMG